MNIFRKVKNNVEYYKWSKIREKSFKKAEEHMDDEDDRIFRYYAARLDLALMKCEEIEI